MRLTEVEDYFRISGAPLRWLEDDTGRMMRALPSEPLALPIDVGIVIPDVHLGIGPGDAFQEDSPSRVARLERFLDVLAALRDSVPADRFAAIQLGDFYDVMRSNQPGAPFERRLSTIAAAYPSILERARRLPLLHCIGNHDHELFANRAMLPTFGINAHVVRALGPTVLAFHGNDLVSLRDVDLDVNYQTWLLSFVQSLEQMPIIGDLVALLQRHFDDSLEDPFFSRDLPLSLPWPAPTAGATVPRNWTAPWVMRDHAAQFGEELLDWENAVDCTLELAIVGHSHRPGISWSEVEVGRRIPVVDVGSWTYGRTEFAVLCADGIGLAELSK